MKFVDTSISLGWVSANSVFMSSEKIKSEKVDLEDTAKRLWQVHTSLYGVGSLLQYQFPEDCDSQGELFGIGEVLKFLAKELSSLESSLFKENDN